MLRFEDWGLIDYELALNRQLIYLEKTHQEQSDGFLIFCTHPPIVTLGRKTQPGDVSDWLGPVQEVSRGGRATYHGPSQLVVYPIVNLEKSGVQRPAKDIGALLRLTENAIVDSLKEFGIQAVGKTNQKKSETDESTEETGVWVGPQKIASLGIGVKKWISYHGAAINLDEDAQAFTGMKPCGFHPSVMISAEKLVGQKIDRKNFSETLAKYLLAGL